MTSERIRDRPNLEGLFGPLPGQAMTDLGNRLLRVDERLTRLAAQATDHVGVRYGVFELTHVLRNDGRSAGVIGGPTGDAGDIWFDVSVIAGEVRTWTVESSIIVFCSDSPEPRGGSNTHPLWRLEGTARTPDELVTLLEAHVAAAEQALTRHSAETYTHTRHDDLPQW